jgi:Peptidase A4 family
MMKRYILPVLAASAALVGAGATAASAQTVNAQQATSANWAGYIVHSNTGNGQFSSVSGSWVVPAVSSSSSTGQGRGYSAFWVGLGGSSDQSQALEQVGTSSDTVNGQTQYYAWYELVPAPETQLNLAVHPGDHVTGKVTVNGSRVTVSLSDQATGQSVTKQLQMSNPDTSSAEWIAEAPASVSQGGNTQILPLADFGKVTFTGASATSGGHTGSISDPDWSVEQVALDGAGSGSQFGGAGIPFSALGSGVGQSGAGAQTSSLSSDGSSFSVSYASDGAALTGASGGSPATSTSGSGAGDPYGNGDGGGSVYVLPGGGAAYVVPGYGGYGYGGYGYGGYGGGYGYGGYGYGGGYGGFAYGY